MHFQVRPHDLKIRLNGPSRFLGQNGRAVGRFDGCEKRADAIVNLDLELRRDAEGLEHWPQTREVIREVDFPNPCRGTPPSLAGGMRFNFVIDGVRSK